MSQPVASSSSLRRADIQRQPLRRLTLELFGIIALKVVLLMLIWWLLFAPQPQPDASPEAIARLLAPTPHPPPPERHP